MNRIRAFVSAKTLTPIDCVRLTAGANYTDVIIQGNDYQNVSQVTISVTNACSVPFTILGMDLFSDNTNGGNFTASVNNFTIGANQTLNVPVYYNGIYLGSNLAPNYQIDLNTNYAVFSLNVTVPEVNNPPVASDITIDLANREVKTLTVQMFLDHFSDIDNDDLAAVIIEGNTQNYTLNGLPLTSGTQIPRSVIESDLLVFTAPDTDNYTEDATMWKAVDTAGSISV